MKLYISLIFMFLITGSIAAQNGNSVDIPLSDPGQRGTLTANIKNSKITIIGSNRQDVKVTYSTERQEDDDDDGERNGLKKIANNSFDFEITENNNHVRINSESWFVFIDITIEVPVNFDIDVENYMGGDIDLSNINGEVVLDSYMGSVHAEGIKGIASASTYTGDVSVSIDELTPDKPMSFTTYTGKIDLTLPSTYKANFKMKTGWGEIYSDLDIVVQSSEPKIERKEGSDTYKLFTDTWTKATLNGGGPEITIKSQMGNIYLRSGN